MEAAKYTDPAAVAEVKRKDPPRYGQTVSGYGAKLPTSYMLKIGTRWYRVYMMQYGNAGSAYVVFDGENCFLDSDTESRLEELR